MNRKEKVKVKCRNCNWEGDFSELIILLNGKLVPPTCPKCYSQKLKLADETEKTVSDYDKAVRMVCNHFLLMLDKELTELEKKNKTGSPYWKRLRRRKRIVQRLLEIATFYPDWKKISQELREEFFRKK